MIIEVDFNSDEALYMQLRNQIILGIATNRFHEGDVLPSVRQLADTIGINMHTVNKAYTVLKQEGFVKVDRRKGAVIAVDEGKKQAMLDDPGGYGRVLLDQSKLQEYFPGRSACFN
mgnify:CR=1 FL=1